MEDVLSATDNFASSKLIGRGGFGLVYKGELSLPEGRIMVAFKRLDRNLGQGNTEFWKEIMMLSKYKHENLISLRNFCIEGDERILVYDYASRGSLDRYLSDANLTWIQRLKICLGVARALDYLHDPMDTQQRLIHRDIKSSNILLDEEWNAKVSDFGLSKIGVANQTRTYQVSNAVGTPGYCDPLYHETGLLSKESDVYSFGVVLFEVMCGKLCCEYSNDRLVCILVHTWKECFAKKSLDDIICHDLKEQINQKSLVTLSTIANRCLNRDHTKRPTMTEIVKKIEVALKQCPAINMSEQDSAIISSRSFPLNSYGDSSGIMYERGKSRTTVSTKKASYEWRKEVSDLKDDGYEWRKYGQKEILGYTHTRLYYRCKHKFSHGCRAVKQVQRMTRSPPMFEVKYIGRHTCEVGSTSNIVDFRPAKSSTSNTLASTPTEDSTSMLFSITGPPSQQAMGSMQID